MNSLGINKLPSQTRIIVAMSGGVDSSVTAALLKEQGYDVAGITLQLYDQAAATQPQCASAVARRAEQGAQNINNAPARTKTCCAGQDIYDARNVAAALNMPHYVLDYENRFRQGVMDDFADAYLRGETPVPCVRCNQRVKFRDLLDSARDLGADALATGHYVKRIEGADGAELHMAEDASRDQSYFLFATTRQQLEFLRFPLGGLAKTEVRRLAARFNLPVAEKPDSQDICFVPNGRYADVVRKLRPGACDPGDIADEAGNVLGRHEGVINFTIGQRKGLNLQGLAGAERAPLYVLAIDAASRRVTVGPFDALAVVSVTLKETNWLSSSFPLPSGGVRGGEASAPHQKTETNLSNRLSIKFRSTMEPVPARIGEQGEIIFETPQHGVAPGQACVVYAGSRVLGGGWIEKTHRSQGSEIRHPKEAHSAFAAA